MAVLRKVLSLLLLCSVANAFGPVAAYGQDSEDFAAAGRYGGDLPAVSVSSGGFRVFSASDHALYVAAFAAADRGDWKTARAKAAQGGDALVAKLIEWRYVGERENIASFAEIDGFLRANPGWPGRETLLARAESKLDLDKPAAVVLGWFGTREPVSAWGRIVLGGAEVAAGKTAAGGQHIRSGWIDGAFDPATESKISSRFSAFLTPDVEAGRLDSLLWKNELTGARRQMLRVDETTKVIAAALIAVKTDSREIPVALAALPADVTGNSGLKFDQARALRKKGDEAGARAILQNMSLAGLARAHPGPLWGELSVAIRQALGAGEGKVAYKMAADAGFLPAFDRTASDVSGANGAEFSEAQFLAGWIALRVLRDPGLAIGHFHAFAASVSRPISVSRGAYWQGRAYEEMADIPHATAAYRAAAANPETFYGMLALAKLETAPVLPVRDTVVRPITAGAFEKDELVRAMLVLADLDQRATLRRFALHYRATHPDLAQTKRLLQFLVEAGYRPLAVRVAKAAGYEGHLFAAYAYPVIPVPPYSGSGAGPEPALVLALIRQETEFDAGAVSSTGARGLMQVMPSGAKGFAKAAGLPFRLADLTLDPTYNMQLGMTMVADYMRRWDNALLLGAAAYNAGPTNARRWVNAFGDPRTAAVDPVDFIESIPFGETRNYVQRVIENVQVYRAVLGGGSAPLRLLDDLYGAHPHPRAIRR